MDAKQKQDPPIRVICEKQLPPMALKMSSLTLSHLDPATQKFAKSDEATHIIIDESIPEHTLYVGIDAFIRTLMVDAFVDLAEDIIAKHKAHVGTQDGQKNNQEETGPKNFEG